MTDVHVDYWTRQSISFKLEDLVDMFPESWDESQQDGLSQEDWVQQIIDEEGFDYVAECDFAENAHGDEIGFEIEID